MEAACRRTVDSLRFHPPHTPNTAAVMVMALTFHTKDPDGARDDLHIFLFPDLPPLAGLEAALLTWKWSAILGVRTLTSFGIRVY